MFTAGGDRMIWSAGYDRGPGPASTSGGTGSTYDLFWLQHVRRDCADDSRNDQRTS
jgi:hypothetical protein